jgi:hypothetical protein
MHANGLLDADYDELNTYDDAKKRRFQMDEKGTADFPLNSAKIASSSSCMSPSISLRKRQRKNIPDERPGSR